jgi:hypothetical protein
MARFGQDEFKFPDEKEAEAKGKPVDTETGELEIEIENDTPVEDRGRKAAPPPEDPTEDELAS